MNHISAAKGTPADSIRVETALMFNPSMVVGLNDKDLRKLLKGAQTGSRIGVEEGPFRDRARLIFPLSLRYFDHLC